ncbi:MAG TPA: hypothetical protein VFJ82_09815 [Longimicrobium sp.]|nr:hypothetical protein [Longimicrobium sp.]
MLRDATPRGIRLAGAAVRWITITVSAGGAGARRGASGFAGASPGSARSAPARTRTGEAARGASSPRLPSVSAPAADADRSPAPRAAGRTAAAAGEEGVRCAAGVDGMRCAAGVDGMRCAAGVAGETGADVAERAPAGGRREPEDGAASSHRSSSPAEFSPPAVARCRDSAANTSRRPVTPGIESRTAAATSAAAVPLAGSGAEPAEWCAPLRPIAGVADGVAPPLPASAAVWLRPISGDAAPSSALPPRVDRSTRLSAFPARGGSTASGTLRAGDGDAARAGASARRDDGARRVRESDAWPIEGWDPGS